MSVRVALEHRMTYRFDRAVGLSPHVVRLRPAPHCRTPILAYSMTVTPREHFINWQQDPFGNHLARLVFPEPARELTVVVDLVADLARINPFDFFVEESAAHYPFTYDDALRRDLTPYFSDEEPTPVLAQWLADWNADRAGSSSADGQSIVAFLVEINQRVFRSVAYTSRMEPGVQSSDETIEKKLGSCRDSAWLLVQILRRVGLAARFVSGYLVQLRPDEPSLDGPVADSTDLHAWAEAYIPGAGWIGLDPTSGLLAGEGHLPLVCSPHPSSAAPITGTTEPCEVTFEFSNTVTRLVGSPSVSRATTEVLARPLRVRVGCEFHYDVPAPTPTVWQVRPRAEPAQRLVSESWETKPALARSSYHDSYGNICDRLTLPAGHTVVRYDAEVEVPGVYDDADITARQIPVESLPDDTMVYLLPSRFCPSDMMRDHAWQLFGTTEPGWARVVAVCDWVHENVQFQMGSSNPLTSSLDVWESRLGVCRDFAHLGLTFCRALNIPARYAFGYLPDIGVPPPYAAMDFCAWFEAYLGGRWWTFDPRNNVPRMGRVVIGRGRDALDVAMVTSYGAPILQSMHVWADEVRDPES